MVLAVVAAAGRALRPALAPLLDAGEVAAVAAALTPHEQPAHHGVAHGAARGRHAAPVAPPRGGRGHPAQDDTDIPQGVLPGRDGRGVMIKSRFQ